MDKVLVVEDEDLIRKGLIFTADWLRAGCVVAGEAADGEEGLRRIAELKPDIVIADIRMPFMDGIAMIEAAREICDFEAILLTGYGEFAYAQKAISLGVTEYLIKPVDFTLLYGALEKSRIKRAAARRTEALGTAAARLPARDIVKMPRGGSKYVARLLDRVRISYREKLTLADLSAEYAVSATYLNAQFKRETGYTVNDFLNRYRIQRAVELLQTGGVKVYEAAAAVGFADYKYFTRVFKKYTGYSPGCLAGGLERDGSPGGA